MKSFFYRLLLAMAILMPFVGQTQLCNDPSEPNATMGQAFDLGELTNTPLQNDSLCLTAGDQDFFQFRHSGTQYFVRVRGFSNNTQGRYGITVRLDSSFISVNTRSINGSRTDTYLYLLDVNSLVLGENDDINRTLFSEVRYNFINPIFLSANPTQLNLAPTNDSTSFVVTASNVNWTITAPTWLTLSTTTGGNGSTTVRVMATNNNTNRERLGYISVNGSNNLRRGIWVNQTAIPFNCMDSFEPNNSTQQATNLGAIATTWQDSALCLSLANDQDFFAVNINNIPYYIRIKGFSFNTIGRYGLRISYSQETITVTTFAANAGENTDTYAYLMNANGDILAQNDDFGGTFYSQIVYNTNVSPFLRVSPGNITMAAINARSIVSVQSNVAWTISTLPNWLTASPMSGGVGNYNITLTASNNLDTSSRMAMLGISGGGQGMMLSVLQQGATISVLNCTDRYEPNNTISQAVPLNNLASITNFQDSTLCLTLGDEDFFRFRIDTVTYSARIRAFSQGASFIGRYGLNIQRISGGFTVSTFSTQGSTADTYLYVMNVAGTTILGQNDDIGGSNRFSSVTISTLPLARPANDEPCTATELRDTMTMVSNLANATLTTRPNPTISTSGGTCPSNTKDVWFTTIVPSSGVVTIRTTAGTMRDAVMAIYRGANCDSIIEPALACEDDNRNGNGAFMPVITVTQPAGTRLYIRVWAFGSQVGTFNIVALPYETANFGNNGNSQQAKIVTTDLNVYPNPASATLTVALKTNDAQKNAPIILIDALGRTVWSAQRSLTEGFNTFDIDVNNIANGLYFLRVDNQMVRVQIIH